MKLPLRTALFRSILCVVLTCLAAACAISPAAGPSSPVITSTLAEIPLTPVENSYYTSTGGGQPRSSAYWLIWNACAPGNQSAAAASNGGREAGWILMEDLLADPGILVGMLSVETCQQGVDLLSKRDFYGADHSIDPAYVLSSHLLAAQLNLAAGAASCPAVEDSVRAAQLLLTSLDFNGTGLYLGPPRESKDRDTALILMDQLSIYNTGELCMP